MHANGIPAGICYCFHSCSILGISKWLWDIPQMEIPWALTSPRLRQHRRSQHVVWYLEGRLKGSPLGRSVTHGVLFDLDLATVIGNTQFEFRKSNEFNMIPHDSSWFLMDCISAVAHHCGVRPNLPLASRLDNSFFRSFTFEMHRFSAGFSLFPAQVVTFSGAKWIAWQAWKLWRHDADLDLMQPVISVQTCQIPWTSATIQGTGTNRCSSFASTDLIWGVPNLDLAWLTSFK